MEALYEAQKNKIFSLCVKLTGSCQDAEELFSETWLKIAEKHKNLQPDKEPVNWMYTVCLNLYRKSYAKARRYGAPVPDGEAILLDTQSNENVESDAVASDEAARLRGAIQKMDDKYRVPLILFYYRDESYQDIVRVMKLPMSTVKYRIHQAKAILRREMGDNSER